MPELRDTGVRNVVCGKMSLFTSPPTSMIAGSAITSSSGRSLRIEGNTRIGANSKIQSHTFICEYVTIGQRCFIGHGVMFANDLFREGKPNADRASWGRIEIGDDVSNRQRRHDSGRQHLRWGGDRRGQRGNEVHYRERRVGGESGEAAAAAINKNADQRVGIPS